MAPIVFHLADKHMEQGLRAFFRRANWHYAMGCDRFEINAESNDDIYRIAGATDPILWKAAGDHLKTHLGTHERAVVIIDEDFDPYPGADQIRKDATQNMLAQGWPEDRFKIIVIEPMLEAWLWADGASTARGFNVPDFGRLRDQLIAEHLWDAGALKPREMKRARDRAASLGGRKTGSAIFRAVFENLSSRAFDQCVEPGFSTLRQALRRWFPTDGGTA